MTNQEQTEKALEVVRTHHPRAKDFEVTNITPDFLDGSLVFVEFVDKAGEDDENYVYVTETEVLRMGDFEDVAALVARNRPTPSGHRLIREAFHVGGVAGIIAILITVSICYLFVFRDLKEVPQVLSASLTTILGFYFGSKVTKK